MAILDGEFHDVFGPAGAGIFLGSDTPIVEKPIRSVLRYVYKHFGGSELSESEVDLEVKEKLVRYGKITCVHLYAAIWKLME